MKLRLFRVWKPDPNLLVDSNDRLQIQRTGRLGITLFKGDPSDRNYALRIDPDGLRTVGVMSHVGFEVGFDDEQSRVILFFFEEPS